MLNDALRVVEAARGLRVVRRGTRVATEHPPAGLAGALGALLEALEAFDAATAEGVGTPELSPRPDWAVPPGLEDGDGAADLLPSLDAVPRGGQEPDDALRESEDRQLALAEAAAAAGARKAAERARPPADGAAPVPHPGVTRRSRGQPADEYVEDGAFFDGDESVGDFLMALDAIDDKLRYAVGKVGWSPRLRQLAEAGRIARQNMYVQGIDESGAWVRMPAAVYASLTVAVAEAALDQDVREPVPPAPRLRTPEEREELRRSRRHDMDPPGPRPQGFV